jgi:hypothetical protein
MFRQGFTCPALLKYLQPHHAYGTITHYGQPFQTARLIDPGSLAYSAFARHYSRNLC